MVRVMMSLMTSHVIMNISSYYRQGYDKARRIMIVAPYYGQGFGDPQNMIHNKECCSLVCQGYGKALIIRSVTPYYGQG